MNKKGFISISLVYAFFLVFIAIILGIIAMYSTRRIMLLTVKEDIRNVIDKNTTYNCFSKGITKLNDCVIETYGGIDAIKSQSTPDFSNITAVSEYGLYSAEDGLGDSYYFRGDVIDNYVQFGQDFNGNDMYWRIVRINGDGTIRLIYDYTDLTGGEDSSNYIIEESFYSDESGNEFVDFNTSIVAERLNAWYTKNLEDYYSSYLAKGIFCNDKRVSDITEDFDEYNNTYNNELFMSFDRLKKNKAPSLECADDSSKVFSKIGIITADEVALAGGVYGISNLSFYLYSGYSFWTMTPYDRAFGSKAAADLWFLNSDGMLQNFDRASYAEGISGIRPVVNLISDIEIKRGNGTIDNPYILEEVGY